MQNGNNYFKKSSLIFPPNWNKKNVGTFHLFRRVKLYIENLSFEIYDLISLSGTGYIT